MKLRPASDKRSFRLADEDAVLVHGKTEKELEGAAEKEVDRIAELQRVFYADERYALLIVLQGRDASGKDGTIRKVFTAVNPQGCTVSTFKAPTGLELRHDFLWRIHQQLPPRGVVGIFNRSHYEDVLVPRVRGWIKKKEWLARYEQINDFERMLTENRVVVLKFLLHISRDEQKRRLEDRLRDEHKNWKFREGDLEDRALWNDFTKAYRGIVKNTSTEWAPWYVVPADDKDVRNLLVARTIADTLKGMRLRYPKSEIDLERIEIP
jgi:PPK2 family polyphosphate:nucleotide phosphotransferase